MKALTVVWITVLMAALTGCGKGEQSYSNMLEVSKCDTAVFVDSDKVAHWDSGFEKFCRFTDVPQFDEFGNPILDSQGNQVVVRQWQEWRHGYRSTRDNTCGFWLGLDGTLVTYNNHELNLGNSADITACPQQ